MAEPSNNRTDPLDPLGDYEPSKELIDKALKERASAPSDDFANFPIAPDELTRSTATISSEDYSSAWRSAEAYGWVSGFLVVGIPVALWWLLLRPWKPRTRLTCAIRFSLWPLVVLSGLPSTRVGKVEGVLVLFVLTAPIFFGIGWWRGRRLPPSRSALLLAREGTLPAWVRQVGGDIWARATIALSIVLVSLAASVLNAGEFDPEHFTWSLIKWTGLWLFARTALNRREL